MECLRWLAEINYAVTFEPSSFLSDRVIFSPVESGGSRLHHGCFTLVTSGKGSVYLASCMGSNGSRELPQILESTDLFQFNVTLVGGGASRFGGMALFPEKFEGRFAAVCHRADGSIYLMYSENEAMWEIAELLRGPQEPWELRGLQVCGAPLRTRAGWLVLYRAASEMDHRAIGAMLVDAHDPSKVLGHLKEPLIAERHVTGRAAIPGVLQSSGSIVHNGRLFVCYTLDQKEVLVDQFDLDAVFAAIRGR